MKASFGSNWREIVASNPRIGVVEQRPQQQQQLAADVIMDIDPLIIAELNYLASQPARQPKQPKPMSTEEWRDEVRDAQAVGLANSWRHIKAPEPSEELKVEISQLFEACDRGSLASRKIAAFLMLDAAIDDSNVKIDFNPLNDL